MNLTLLLGLICASIAAIVIVLVWEISGRWAYLTSRSVRRLHEAETLDSEMLIDAYPQKSLRRKLAEANIRLTPVQFFLMACVIGLGGAFASWIFFVPGLPSLMVGIVVGYVPFAYIREKSANRGRKIDESLAVALSRMSAGLSLGRGLADVLDEVARSLLLEGANPLADELMRTVKEIRSHSVEQALVDLACRAPSLSLANVAVLLESYQRAGGGHYAQVFADAASSIQHILALRAHAQAKAAQPLSSARLIPLMLGGILLVMLSDPLTRTSFSLPAVQLVLAAAITLMATGYLYMRSLVYKAV